MGGADLAHQALSKVGFADRTPRLNFSSQKSPSKNEVLEEIREEMKQNFKKHKNCLEDYMSLVMLRKHNFQIKKLEIQAKIENLQ